jgi:hypothetical protein
MGLSIEELQVQSAECLPAREVMSLLGGYPGGGAGNAPGNTALHDNEWGGLVGADIDLQQINVLGVQNVNIFQFTGDDSDLFDAFNGYDSDVVDIG